MTFEKYLQTERTMVRTFWGTSNPNGATGPLLHQKMYPQSAPITMTSKKNLKSKRLLKTKQNKTK